MRAHDPRPMLQAIRMGMPGRLKWIAATFVALGVGAAAWGLWTSRERTLAAFVVNFVYWAGISQGGLLLGVAMVIVKGRWGRPLKRLGEAMSMFMVPLYLLLVLFLVGGGLDIYPWMHWTPELAPPHKGIWFRPGFMVAREVVLLGILIVLNLMFVRASLRADVGVAVSRYGIAGPSWWAGLVADWRGDAAEIDRAQARQAAIAPGLAIAYAVVFSIMVVDLSMSLAPFWYANMFPAWYFASCFWSGLVWLGILSLALRDRLAITPWLGPSVYHDLGKLTFGFTMFWAYTLFAQYLAIWYGNMTEEIGFVLVRTHLDPWSDVSKAVLALCFLVPFTMLLSRGLKKLPAAYLAVTGILAAGIWLERFLVVMPSVWMHDTLPLGPVEIGMTLGFLGGFLLVVVGFLSRVPPLVFTDPYLGPDPEHVHVVPGGAAH